ncbi:hypothetical protein VTI74DRAFT_5152 [Chaetomium olivicolor]
MLNPQGFQSQYGPRFESLQVPEQANYCVGTLSFVWSRCRPSIELRILKLFLLASLSWLSRRVGPRFSNPSSPPIPFMKTGTLSISRLAVKVMKLFGRRRHKTESLTARHTGVPWLSFDLADGEPSAVPCTNLSPFLRSPTILAGEVEDRAESLSLVPKVVAARRNPEVVEQR